MVDILGYDLHEVINGRQTRCRQKFSSSSLLFGTNWQFAQNPWDTEKSMHGRGKQLSRRTSVEKNVILARLRSFFLYSLSFLYVRWKMLHRLFINVASAARCKYVY